MRHPALLTLTLVLGACTAETGELDAASVQVTRDLLARSPQYSAYDGEHAYPAVFGISRAALAAGSDVDWPTVRWTFDDTFLEQTDYRVLDGTAGDDFIEVRKYYPLAGTAVFTTKRTGSTRVGVVFRTLDGAPLRGEAELQISQASAEEWSRGDAYFNKSSMIQQQPGRAGICGAPASVEIPRQTNCMNCHNTVQMIFSPCTPLQTAGYSDEQLLGTLARGEMPADILGWSSFLKATPDPECIFDDWHSPDDIDDATTRGLLWKLRSLVPTHYPMLDLGFATQPVVPDPR